VQKQRVWVEKAKVEILNLLKEHKTMYNREIKIALEEKKFWDWIVENAIRELHEELKIRRKRRRAGNSKPTFYFLAELSYYDVVDKINEKIDVISQYSAIGEAVDPEKRPGVIFESEVIECLKAADFMVAARNTNFFNGKRWPCRNDLDLIVYGEEEKRWYGVSVKDKLDCPTMFEVQTHINLCKHLGLTPWIVCRYLPDDRRNRLWNAGGCYTLFWERKWWLPPQHAEIAKQIKQKTAIPVVLPDEYPSFRNHLIEDLRKIHRAKLKKS